MLEASCSERYFRTLEPQAESDLPSLGLRLSDLDVCRASRSPDHGTQETWPAPRPGIGAGLANVMTGKRGGLGRNPVAGPTLVACREHTHPVRPPLSDFTRTPSRWRCRCHARCLRLHGAQEGGEPGDPYVLDADPRRSAAGRGLLL